jgi:hypothetical protein
MCRLGRTRFRFIFFMRFRLCLLGLFGFFSGAFAAETKLELGANFNEHLQAARIPALDATGVTWVRGFLPAGEFLDGRRALATDPGVATFAAAAATGRKLAISLKWDFKRSKWRVPAPDSESERAAFAWAVDAARVMRPDMLLLVNEVFIDTEADDMKPGPDGAIPMVRFLQRLAAHVAAVKLTTREGRPLPVSCGGFTRINTLAMQKHPATQALLPWLASTPHLTHVNFHMHQGRLEEFADALAFMRRAVPDRPFVVTEFSLVWAFQDSLEETLGAGKAGEAFARAYQRNPRETVGDYLNAAAENPIPEAELHAFLRSRTWFDPRFLEESCRMMERAGVTLATYAYLQESSGLENPRRKLSSRAGQPPWRLNAIFQERHARRPDGQPARNLGYYDTFVEWQKSWQKH